MSQNHGFGVIYRNKFKDEDLNVVFFDLETSGLHDRCDILQIGLKCGKKKFDIYVNPSRDIPDIVTEINGLSNHGQTLYLHGDEVDSVSPRTALSEMLDFLEDLGGPCALVAHNCHNFDAPRLVRLIQIFDMEDEFADVIEKFVDTLPLYLDVFSDRSGRGQFRLMTLTDDFLPFNIKYSHDAFYDCFLLEQLVYRHFDFDDLMDYANDFDDYL